jgi:hypothetical protein
MVVSWWVFYCAQSSRDRGFLKRLQEKCNMTTQRCHHFSGKKGRLFPANPENGSAIQTPPKTAGQFWLAPTCIVS